MVHGAMAFKYRHKSFGTSEESRNSEDKILNIFFDILYRI
jgi:hypothetical protein